MQASRPRLLALLCAVALALPAVARAAEKTFDLSEAPLGTIPSGFTNLLAGSGAPGDWRIVDDDAPSVLQDLSGQSRRRITQRALAQVSRDAADERFPLLVYDLDTYGDFTFTTSLKMVAGEKEQMAGIVFRFQDPRNFYYVRASALGGTLYFLKVVDGVRSDPIGARMEIRKGVWHELSVECRGNRIRVLFNGKEAIPAMTDKSFTAGKLGFWTKSDSVSHFANARVSYVPRETLAQTLVREVHRRFELEDVRIYARSPKDQSLRVIASLKPEDVGVQGTDLEQDVLKRSRVYQSRISKSITMTLPLHDANGDTVAAVRIVMKSFLGETEKTALNRAVPVVQRMEKHFRTERDLLN